MSEYAVELNHITKKFGDFKANDDVTVKLRKGEIHALLGENGAGKSTLMNVLFGFYKPDEGEIKVDGEEVRISNPNDATDYGIGMVHQHFKLVEDFTVLQNIVLGVKNGAVALPMETSKFRNFNQQQYDKIYEELVAGSIQIADEKTADRVDEIGLRLLDIKVVK